jgi:hypothetical protein
VRGGHVACATAMRDWVTSNALVEDSFKKSTEGHHDAFARVEPNYWVISIDTTTVPGGFCHPVHRRLTSEPLAERPKTRWESGQNMPTLVFGRLFHF